MKRNRIFLLAVIAAGIALGGWGCATRKKAPKFITPAAPAGSASRQFPRPKKVDGVWWLSLQSPPRSSSKQER